MFNNWEPNNPTRRQGFDKTHNDDNLQINLNHDDHKIFDT